MYFRLFSVLLFIPLVVKCFIVKCLHHDPIVNGNTFVYVSCKKNIIYRKSCDSIKVMFQSQYDDKPPLNCVIGVSENFDLGVFSECIST